MTPESALTLKFHRGQSDVGATNNNKYWLKILKAVFLMVFLVGLHILFIYKVTVFYSGEHVLLIRIYILLTGLFLISRFPLSYLYVDSHNVDYPDSAYPSVSFVIAAKNEEDSIYKTIATCLDSDYPGDMECIAVDDGSDDETYLAMRLAQAELSKEGKRVKVIKFEQNKGKREGMTEGVLNASGSIVVFVDSDSFLEKGATKHIVEHFLEDEGVAAVSGNTGVENADVNALTKMQSARYGISFDIFKSCESVFGAVTCCPGCFSAYRKDRILEVLDLWRNQTFLGTKSTFGDDRSLTNYILRNHKVVYCQSAKAVTIVPEKYSKYMKQQLRWKKSWVREGWSASKFMWRKNFVASFSFYTNLLLPIFSPLIVFNAIFISFILFGILPITFMIGVLSLSFLYGLYYWIQSSNKYWLYIVPFTLYYTLILVWQMPYALFRLRDTKWGTR